MYAEIAEDDDIVLDSTGQLPLFVEHYHLTNSSEFLFVTLLYVACASGCYINTTQKKRV